MSHAPPVPDAQRAPWPAHPAPIQHRETPQAAEAGQAAEPTVDTPRHMTKLGMGMSAAAIGSAAVAAALLYVNYGRKR